MKVVITVLAGIVALVAVILFFAAPDIPKWVSVGIFVVSGVVIAAAWLEKKRPVG